MSLFYETLVHFVLNDNTIEIDTQFQIINKYTC